MIYSTSFVHALLYNIGNRFCNANNTINTNWQEWRDPSRVEKPLDNARSNAGRWGPRGKNLEHATSAHASHASHASSHAASWWTLLFGGFSDCNFSCTE